MQGILKSAAALKAAAKDPKRRGELTSVSVEPAENGFTVRCNYAPKPAKKKTESPIWCEPEVMVFESAAKAAAYVGAALAKHESYEGSSEDVDDDE